MIPNQYRKKHKRFDKRRNIEALKMAISAIEKQISKKVDKSKGTKDWSDEE